MPRITIIIGDDELAKNEGKCQKIWKQEEVTTISLDKIADCLK